MNQSTSILALGHLHPQVGYENRPRYVLTGGTFKHRLMLHRLGWEYKERFIAWILDMSDSQDEALKFARSLRGVEMKKLFNVVPKKREDE